LQADGVSSNWGGVTFAFLEYLVRTDVVKKFDMARNPVGNTHEEGKKWSTLDGFIKLIKDCFYQHDVIVNVITAILDCRGWLRPVLDPGLALYSRHGSTQGCTYSESRRELEELLFVNSNNIKATHFIL